MADRTGAMADRVKRRRPASPVLTCRAMAPSPDTVSIAFVRGMLSGVATDAGTSLGVAGIAPSLLDEPSSRVTAEQYVALFAHLMERLDDEFLGLLSRPLRRGTLALLLRATLGSVDLAQALRRLTRAFRLLQDDVRVELVADGALAGIRLAFAPHVVARPFLHELQLRVFWRVADWLHGGRLRAARFDFAFAAPAHAAEYAKVFPGDVRFDAPGSAVWFASRDLEAPMLRDESAMRAFLARAPGIVVVPQHDPHTTHARVRGYLLATRPAWPDLAATAAALHRSASTLQRRLAAEGSSFQMLKDHLRRDLAIVRLSTTNDPLAVIAADLGFADSPAFQRAFKQWTGGTTGTYRGSSAPLR